MKYGDEHLDLSGRDVTIARVISRVAPAPLINFYVGLILAIWSPIGLGPILTPITMMVICILVMVVLPITPIVIQAWRGSVDLDVSERASRPKFFLWSILCYALAYVIYTLTDCLIMSALAAAYFFVTAGVMLTSFKTKASVHVAGIAGPGTALIMVFGAPALLGIVAWLLVAWSRTVLQQHTLVQTLLGIVLGAAITTGTYLAFYFPLL